MREYSDQQNQYATVLSKVLGMGYLEKEQQQQWSINKQHVCIYAKILFTDAQSLGKPIRGDVSPSRRISRIDTGMLTNAFSVGSDVSIFELFELITKHSIETSLGQFILENFKPIVLMKTSNELGTTEYVDEESEYLEFAILKITAKCSRFGFD